MKRRVKSCMVFLLLVSVMVLSVQVPVGERAYFGSTQPKKEIVLDENLARSQNIRTYEQLEATLHNSKEVQIHVARTQGSIESYHWRSGYPAELEHISQYCQLLIQELSRYPSGSLSGIGLKRIHITPGLKSEYNRPILGLADTNTGFLYLDPTIDLGEIAQLTIHHEIGHMLAHAASSTTTKQWPAIQARLDTAEPSDSYFFPEPGFVTKQSRLSDKEDFAEVYGLLFLDRQDQLNAASSGDEILSQKVQLVRAAAQTAQLLSK